MYLIDIAASELLEVASFEELVQKVLEHKRFYLLQQVDSSWRPVYWCQHLDEFMTFSAHLPAYKAGERTICLTSPHGEVLCPADMRSLLRCAVEQRYVLFEYRRSGAWFSTRVYIRQYAALDYAVEAASHILEKGGSI